jgi:type I restriction enzyme S subunit
MRNVEEHIPSNWQVKKFENVAYLRHGYQFRTYDFTEEGVKVFKITQIKSEGSIDISGCSLISEERLEYFERVKLSRGDILMALTGATIGKIARFNSDETILQNYRVGNFFPLNDQELNKDFFYYFLSSDFFFNQILARQTQSAQQNIGKEEINQMSLILPPLPTQKRIAEILGALDDKIELNLQMNKTLEEMAMALYKHWFVDTSSTQSIPLSDYIELNPRLSIKKKQSAKFVEMKAVPENNPCISYYFMKEFNSGTKFQNDDTLFARITPCLENGKTGFVDFLENGETGFGSTEFLILRAKEKISPYYVYCLSRDEEFRKHAIGTMVGTSGRQRVQNEPLMNYMVSKIDLDIMTSYHDTVAPYFKMIHNNTIENQTLTELRDYLLPILVSGEVIV